MGCCGSKSQTTESERLLPLPSSTTTKIATPSPSASTSAASAVSPVAPHSRSASSSNQHTDTKKVVENTKPASESPPAPRRGKEEFLEAAESSSKPPASSFRVDNDSHKSQKSISQSETQGKSTSPKPSRKSLKLNLASTRTTEAPSLDNDASAAATTSPRDPSSSKSPRSPLSPRQLLKKVGDKIKNKSKKKLENREIESDGSEEEKDSNQVQIDDFPEEISVQPTEEQKAALQKKKQLDLRTDDFVPEFFEELKNANEDPKEESQESGENKKKSAKEIFRGALALRYTFKSITPKKKEKKSVDHDDDEPVSPRSPASPRQKRTSISKSEAARSAHEGESDGKAEPLSPRHERQISREPSNTQKELRDILAKNNIKLSERGEKLERLGETMDEMEVQSSKMRSLASQILQEAKK